MNEKMILTSIVVVGLVVTTGIIVQIAKDSIAEGRCTKVGNRIIEVSSNC